MRIIAVLALAGALAGCAAGAHAGPYTDAVDKQRRCAAEGEMGAEAYSHGTILGMPLKEHTAAHGRGEVSKDATLGIMLIFGAVRMPGLASEKDAYMKVWGECMDRKQ